MYTQDYDFILKLVFVGNSGVGKTSISENFVDEIFYNRFESTIGVDFKTKILDIDGKKAKIQIWDTAGQEKFRAITKSYYRSADAMIIVFDLSKKESFDEIEGWLEEVKNNSNSDPRLFLVGNKSDLPQKVKTEDALKIANEYNMVYTECSAKTSDNINSLFENIAKLTFDHCLLKNTLKLRNAVNLNNDSQKRNKCCIIL